MDHGSHHTIKPPRTINIVGQRNTASCPFGAKFEQQAATSSWLSAAVWAAGMDSLNRVREPKHHRTEKKPLKKREENVVT